MFAPLTKTMPLKVCELVKGFVRTGLSEAAHFGFASDQSSLGDNGPDISLP
jgi:hypothetical protein